MCVFIYVCVCVRVYICETCKLRSVPMYMRDDGK